MTFNHCITYFARGMDVDLDLVITYRISTARIDGEVKSFPEIEDVTHYDGDVLENHLFDQFEDEILEAVDEHFESLPSEVCP